MSLDSEQLTAEQKQAEAERRANNKHPKPKFDPLMAACSTAAIAGMSVSTFTGLARIDLEQYAPYFGITIAIAFCIPYFYFRNAENKYRQNYVEELTAIDKREWRKSAKVQKDTQKN